MSSDHTPGPWWKDDDGCIAAGGTDDYKTICILIDDDKTPFEAQGNAVLIEKAPEMYQALKEIQALGVSNPNAVHIAWTILFKINEAQLAIPAEPAAVLTDNNERVFIPIEQALAMLPDSDMIPTLMQVNNMHFTADWHKTDLIAAMKQKHPQTTGARATAAGYGLAIAIDSEADLFIKTKKEPTP